jgi:hypothetical protein
MVFLSGSALFSLCFEPGGKCPEILRQVGNAPTENRELLVEILNVFIDNLVSIFCISCPQHIYVLFTPHQPTVWIFSLPLHGRVHLSQFPLLG